MIFTKKYNKIESVYRLTVAPLIGAYLKLTAATNAFILFSKLNGVESIVTRHDQPSAKEKFFSLYTFERGESKSF